MGGACSLGAAAAGLVPLACRCASLRVDAKGVQPKGPAQQGIGAHEEVQLRRLQRVLLAVLLPQLRVLHS